MEHARDRRWIWDRRRRRRRLRGSVAGMLFGSVPATVRRLRPAPDRRLHPTLPPPSCPNCMGGDERRWRQLARGQAGGAGRLSGPWLDVAQPSHCGEPGETLQEPDPTDRCRSDEHVVTTEQDLARTILDAGRCHGARATRCGGLRLGSPTFGGTSCQQLGSHSSRRSRRTVYTPSRSNHSSPAHNPHGHSDRSACPALINSDPTSGQRLGN
jgi:hypothetical protein